MNKIFFPKLICLAVLMFSFLSINAAIPPDSHIARGEARQAHLQNHPNQFHLQGQYHPQAQQYHPGARGFERGVEAGATGVGGGVVNPGYTVPVPVYPTTVPVVPQGQPVSQ